MLFGGSVTRSFDGPLQTVTFTPLVVPTGSQVNADFGPGNHANPAARLSLLYRDTDIDFMILAKGARSTRFGFDFARNLSTNLEIHGEWARVRETAKPVLGAGGAVAQRPAPPRAICSACATSRSGKRPGSSSTTATAPATRKRRCAPTSRSSQRARSDQFQATGNTAALARANAVQSSYGRPNPMQRYLYVRASQKEPFDILYFTPALTAIANLEDRSYSIAPELSYTGITNLDLRLRFFALQGGRQTEFGEKHNDRRVELRARYYF